jgi:hypothetical protein
VWLAEQVGQGQNLTWSALAKKLAFRRAEALDHQESDLEGLAVGQFLQLVLEYLDARNRAEPKIEPIKRRTLARGR